eukprot:CAMPEP_0172434036 /NCGR_PEP_ID=MMETSP1064-20121228/70418_1 /TAXON_ID=202472 /ORGANISM="Aulacoseira subarctica , Strain CCAP 1002/5" /LENGTH=387 /DNA_ID=CAMNT_0013182233 /DNA_START=302 /DNA_END=1462 /DNA_ORIENTATION=+
MPPREEIISPKTDDDMFPQSFSSRNYSGGFKVAVLGAAGGIGQPLSLLFKLSPEVSELACYDVANAPGVAADLSHIPTKAKVFGASPEDDGLATCLKGSDLVVIPAGVPRKPGMTRDDLFNINASIVKALVEGCATHCPNAIIAIISNPVNSIIPIAAEVLKQRGVYDPRKLLGVSNLDVTRARTFLAESQGWDPKDVNVPVVGGHAGITILPLSLSNAIIAIISNPVNSTVPIAAEVLKQHGVYDPRKVIGVTTLDIVRARTFLAESQGWDPKDVNVPVVGGHAGITILPLFSQVSGVKLSDEELEAITVRTQFGGDEVVKAKAGTGSATLSMAYAGFLFGENVLKALRGEDNIVQCAYVESTLTEAKFFASPCKFGKNGVEEVLP